MITHRYQPSNYLIIGLQISLVNLKTLKIVFKLRLKQNYEVLRTAERAVPLQEKSLTRANEY